MPILDQNQIFFTPFEPKQSNRFVVSIDVKSIAVGFKIAICFLF